MGKLYFQWVRTQQKQVEMNVIASAQHTIKKYPQGRQTTRTHKIEDTLQYVPIYILTKLMKNLLTYFATLRGIIELMASDCFTHSKRSVMLLPEKKEVPCHFL